MPFCGFNKKMLKGLTAFNEGLVEYGLIYRSEKNGETLDQAIKREISDMARFIPELHRIDDTAKKILTEGIVKYAMGFYLTMRNNNIQDNNIEKYKELIGNINDYFHSMDKKYYSTLEGQPNDMKKLTEYLNTKEIKIKDD